MAQPHTQPQAQARLYDQHAPSACDDCLMAEPARSSIREWFKQRLKGLGDERILFIVGPPGCGKSALVRALCIEYRCKLQCPEGVDSMSKLRSKVVEGATVQPLGSKHGSNTAWLFPGVDGYILKDEETKGGGCAGGYGNAAGGYGNAGEAARKRHRGSSAPGSGSDDDDDGREGNDSEHDDPEDGDPKDDGIGKSQHLNLKRAGAVAAPVVPNGIRRVTTNARPGPNLGPGPASSTTTVVMSKKRGTGPGSGSGPNPTAARSGGSAYGSGSGSGSGPSRKRRATAMYKDSTDEVSRMLDSVRRLSGRGCVAPIVFTAHDCPTWYLQLIKNDPVVKVVRVPKPKPSAIRGLLQAVRDAEAVLASRGSSSGSADEPATALRNFSAVTNEDLAAMTMACDGDIRQGLILLEAAALQRLRVSSADSVVDVFSAATKLLQLPGAPPKGRGPDVDDLYRIATQYPNTLRLVHSNMYRDIKDDALEAMADVADAWSTSVDRYEKIAWRHGSLDSIEEKAAVYHAMCSLAVAQRPRFPSGAKLAMDEPFRAWDARLQFVADKHEAAGETGQRHGYPSPLARANPVVTNEYLTLLRHYKQAVQTLGVKCVQLPQEGAQTCLREQGLNPALWQDSFYCRFGVPFKVIDAYGKRMQVAFGKLGMKEFGPVPEEGMTAAIEDQGA